MYLWLDICICICKCFCSAYAAPADNFKCKWKEQHAQLGRFTAIPPATLHPPPPALLIHPVTTSNRNCNSRMRNIRQLPKLITRTAGQHTHTHTRSKCQPLAGGCCCCSYCYFCYCFCCSSLWAGAANWTSQLLPTIVQCQCAESCCVITQAQSKEGEERGGKGSRKKSADWGCACGSCCFAIAKQTKATKQAKSAHPSVAATAIPLD